MKVMFACEENEQGTPLERANALINGALEGMSACISIILIIFYICCGAPELIIGAGLFCVGAEISVVTKRMKNFEIDIVKKGGIPAAEQEEGE